MAILSLLSVGSSIFTAVFLLDEHYRKSVGSEYYVYLFVDGYVGAISGMFAAYFDVWVMIPIVAGIVTGNYALI